MATGLKCEYEGLTQNYLHGVLDTIQKSIRQKVEFLPFFSFILKDRLMGDNCS